MKTPWNYLEFYLLQNGQDLTLEQEKIMTENYWKKGRSNVKPLKLMISAFIWTLCHRDEIDLPVK